MSDTCGTGRPASKRERRNKNQTAGRRTAERTGSGEDFWLDGLDGEEDTFSFRPAGISGESRGRRNVSDRRTVFAERERRRAEACRKRRRQLRLYRMMTGAAAAVLVLAFAAAVWMHKSGSVAKVQAAAAADAAQGAAGSAAADSAAQDGGTGTADDAAQDGGTGAADSAADASSDSGSASDSAGTNEAGFFDGYAVHTTEATAEIPSELDMTSEYAVMVDLGSGEVVAEKNSNEVIYPASMTKILTVLTAADFITEADLENTFVITQDITDYVFSNGCSAVNWNIDETVTVRDLLYGTILESGGDAALGLAIYCAGSEEAFVQKMNEKAQSLGLGDTAHFATCIGVFDENNYCTVTDMAMILKAAVENPMLRQVLSEHTYTTSATTEHPDGITISNWFLRRIEDKDTGGKVECAKTGFVNQSGNCAASFGVSDSGRNYICVTANTWSAWRCIYDHVTMYKTYGS